MNIFVEPALWKVITLPAPAALITRPEPVVGELAYMLPYVVPDCCSRSSPPDAPFKSKPAQPEEASTSRFTEGLVVPIPTLPEESILIRSLTPPVANDKLFSERIAREVIPPEPIIPVAVPI